jgi:hypothetical protein
MVLGILPSCLETSLSFVLTSSARFFSILSSSGEGVNS